MPTTLIYSPSLDSYDFGPSHPLRPERVSLAVDLIRTYGLAAGDATLAPRPATRDDLLRVHHADYIATVEHGRIGHGIGPGDTPAFTGMHDAASLVAGASCVALEAVLVGTATRAFSPAGGLHHAHRDRAAGFCVYNDAAVAIAAALAHDPELRIAYVDTDAHHGDGVQEAFYAEPRVLTISLHEDGRYLYPGTGSYRERGEGAGLGTALNIPMPPYATPECYLLAFDRIVAPAVRSFAPDILVTQNGADAHWSDPLTSLGMTLGGYEALYVRLATLADEITSGRMVALGGGGYSWRTVVPRVWTLLAASLAGETLPDALPASWIARVRAFGGDPPATLREDPGPDLDDATRALVLHDTEYVIGRLLETATDRPRS